MRAQSQNKLPVSSINSQDAPKHVEEPQGNEFELVARLSQSRFVEEQDDNYVDPGPTAEFEEAVAIPDIAPAEEVQAPSRKFKKGKKKSQSTTSVSPVMT